MTELLNRNSQYLPYFFAMVTVFISMLVKLLSKKDDSKFSPSDFNIGAQSGIIAIYLYSTYITSELVGPRDAAFKFKSTGMILALLTLTLFCLYVGKRIDEAVELWRADKSLKGSLNVAWCWAVVSFCLGIFALVYTIPLKA